MGGYVSGEPDIGDTAATRDYIKSITYISVKHCEKEDSSVVPLFLDIAYQLDLFLRSEESTEASIYLSINY